MRTLKFPIVLINWIDSSSLGRGTWFPMGELDNVPSTITTIGFLVHEDKMAVTVVGGYGDDSYNAQSNITIPKCAIKKMRKIKV